MKLVLVVVMLLAGSTTARAEEARLQRDGEFKRALMQRFDRDGDGRLNQRERLRAARVLARIQHALVGKRDGMTRQRMRDPSRRQQREERRQQRDAEVDIYVR